MAPFPGNYYIEFFNDPQVDFVFANNNYSATKDDYGQINYNSQNRKIIELPSKTTIESPVAIKHLVKHPIKNEFALIYYYRDSNYDRLYIFEIRNSKP